MQAAAVAARAQVVPMVQAAQVVLVALVQNGLLRQERIMQAAVVPMAVWLAVLAALAVAVLEQLHLAAAQQELLILVVVAVAIQQADQAL